MPLLLARIDDRFIHGQVTVGWCRKLEPDHIVLCNDEIAADPWQRRVYASSVPPRIRVWVRDRAGTAALLGDGPGALPPDEGAVLLTGGPADMLDLARRGVPLPAVNVGGMHIGGGKRELLESVYVDRADLASLRALLAAGSRLTAQTVPGTRAVEIDRALLDMLEEAR